jgi:hypothetical protein
MIWAGQYGIDHTSVEVNRDTSKIDLNNTKKIQCRHGFYVTDPLVMIEQI